MSEWRSFQYNDKIVSKVVTQEYIELYVYKKINSFIVTTEVVSGLYKNIKSLLLKVV